MSKNVSSSQNISLVQVKNCWFDTDVHFHIYGLITFKKCQFTFSELIFSIFQNIIEFKPSTEHLEQVPYYAANHKIKLLECNFTGNYWHRYVIFNVHGVLREILQQQCSFHRSRVMLNVSNKTLEYCNTVSAVVYSVENSSFDSSSLLVYTHSQNSFASIRYSYVLLNQSDLIQYDTGGYVGFYLWNCTFFNIKYGAIFTLQTTYINISHCYFKLIESSNCPFDGCIIQAEGRLFGSDLAKKLFFPTCTSSWLPCVKIEIHNTQFIGTPETNKFIIKTTFLSLILNKNQFSAGNQSRSFTGTAFVESMWPPKFLLIETKFDASESVTKNHIPVIVTKSAFFLDLIKTHILCPKTYRAAAVSQKDVYLSFIVSCKEACKIDEYTYDGGSMIINGSFNAHKKTTSLASNITEPSCNACPVGGKCDGNIKSLPNYWGYKNDSDHVVMIRCPDGYCCQNDHTCQGISSCQEGRTGTLCGRCIENLTESLISPKCIDSSKCYTELVLIMYFLSSLSYAVGILTIDSIKRKVLELFKMLYKLIRKKSSKKGQKENVDTNVKKDDKADDGMKYLQILFYYVQDAELFKINLTTDYQKEESLLIKFFQMSPEIVSTLYTKVSEFCFTSTTTAITKMWLKLMFGPCVMAFLFFLFIAHLALLKCKIIHDKHLKSMRSCMTRAFLLVYLFTYQQMIKGAFTLIQCVQVNKIKVLYICGSTKCDTWWQVAIEIFIFSNLIPALFVLSSTPYYVRDKKISLTTFHLACLFPIPVLLVYTFNSLNQLLRGRRPVSSEIISMREHSNSESIDHSNVSIDTLGQKYSMLSSDTDLGSEYSHESIEDINILNDNNSDSEGNLSTLNLTELKTTSREQVIHTLLEHYKTIKLFGVKLTWLGIHKLYRTILVACNTYITEPLTRIYFMTLMLLIIAALNSVVRPYKKNTANAVAVLSYVANICIAIINIGKSYMMTFTSITNESFRIILLSYLETCENVLLIYVPVTAAGLWVANQGIKKCSGKVKNK